MLECLVFSA